MSDEQQAAQGAHEEEVTIFDKIVAGDIPCDKIFEDDLCIAFRDINPTAKTHFLVIPKNRDGLTTLAKMEEKHKELVGHLLLVSAKVAEQEGLGDGYRTVINTGVHGCQSVYHLHIHVIGGEQLSWPATGIPMPSKD